MLFRYFLSIVITGSYKSYKHGMIMSALLYTCS